MSYWSWNNTLSVGIDVIDDQHRRIVDYINELDAAYLKKDKDKVTEILMGLVDYTISHFSFEEKLMADGGYPLSDAYKKVHESFIARINIIKNSMKVGVMLPGSLCQSYRYG